MKEELQNKLTEALEMTLSGVEKGTDFLEEELPLYIQELLLWFGVYEGVMCLIGVLMFCFIPKVYKTLVDFVPEGDCTWYRDDSGTIVIVGVFYIMLSATVLFIYIFWALTLVNLTWLQILVAPRVWLVEYMSKMVS